MTKKFGDSQKKISLQQAMSQENIAQKLYVHRSCISGLEHDISIPTVKNKKKLVAAFDINTSELFKS